MPRAITSVTVTGGASSLGLEVCRQLRERGVEVLLFDLPEQILRVRDFIPASVQIFYGSILDSVALRDAMHDRSAVVHLAERMGVQHTEDNKLASLEMNIDGTRNILDIAVAEQVSRMVFSSSAEVYGAPQENPVSEQAPTSGHNVAAVGKLTGEALCSAYAERYSRLSFAILRYFNVYGPYQTQRFAIPRFVSSVLQGRAPVIHGDGKQLRSYCHVRDAAGATVEAALRTDLPDQVFNIGSDSPPVTVSELAELVISLAGKEREMSPTYQPEFEFTDRSPAREVAARYCDVTRAREVLGFSPAVDLSSGISELLDKRAVLDLEFTGKVLRSDDISGFASDLR